LNIQDLHLIVAIRVIWFVTLIYHMMSAVY